MSKVKQIKLGETTYDIEPTNSEVLGSSHITGALGYTPVNKAGDTMTGDLNMNVYKITSLADPTDSYHAANKKYVDDKVSSYLPLAAGASHALTGKLYFNGLSYGIYNSGNTGFNLTSTIDATTSIYPATDASYDLGFYSPLNRRWRNLYLSGDIYNTVNGVSLSTVSGGGASSIQMKFWKGTQAQYNSITTKDNNTFYIIVG